MTTGAGVTASASSPAVVPLPGVGGPSRRGITDPLLAAAAVVAVTLSCSPLAFGYFAFTSWAPLSIAAIVLLVLLSLIARTSLTRAAKLASLGLVLLLALSFASILWAQSRDSAWTSANQLALYVAIFAIGLLAIRTRRSARIVLLILGLPALLTSVVLALVLALGGGGTAYLLGRLNQPIGYVNATAGMLAMGVWPWLAIAETASRRWQRVFGLSSACLIAAIAVTTQARALIPAFLVTSAVVMIAAPGRTRRGVHLAMVGAAIMASSPWTLAIYSSTGPIQQYMPPEAVLRGAGIAVLGSGALGAILSLTLELLAGRFTAAQRDRISRRLGRAMLAGVAATLVAFGIAAHGTISTQWNDFTHLNPEQAAPDRFLAIGSGFRYDLWRVALEEFRAEPLGGVGAGNYDDSYYRLRHNPQSVTVPHSLEMQMLAELGIGGIVGLLLFCGGVLRAGLSPGRGTLARGDPAIRIAALGLFTAWLTETSFDWLYNIPGLTGMAMLAAAILLVRSPSSRGDVSTGRRRQVTLAVGLGILALLAASIGRQYVATLYSDAAQRLVAQQPVKALRTLRTAEQLDPWSMQTQFAVASAYARLNDYGAASTVLLHAEQLEPENYVPPALLGDIATRAGHPAAALRDYRRALRLDPREPVLQRAVQRAVRSSR